MRSTLYLTASLIAVTTAAVFSQVVTPVGPMGLSSTVGSSTKSGQALINATAVDTNVVPIPNAIVRLRNLELNQIEQIVTANQTGGFTFVARPDVAYVLEVVDRAGRILAVSDVITAQAGDVAGAIVAVPTRLSAISGLFTETATIVMTAATQLGITVVDPPPPLSPEK